MKLKNFFLIIFIIVFFQACSVNQQTIKSVAQTNSASEIIIYKNEILNLLSQYKNKLDKRNPYSYNKDLSKKIYSQINKNQDLISIVQNGKKLENYDEYLYYAFSKESVKNRNDFLILGLYKLIYKAYILDQDHQFTAMGYNKIDMQKLHKYLQVIRWKVRHSKDLNGNYLFVTWQNNWQLELKNRELKDLNIIKDLRYIKSKEESLFSHSNFSFEVIISDMIVNLEHTLKKVNVEPLNMSISAIRSFVFII